MSKQLYIVYETDEWHSTASRDCKGVFMSKTSAIRSITNSTLAFALYAASPPFK